MGTAEKQKTAEGRGVRRRVPKSQNFDCLIMSNR
jgi:hypothetical protein